jgi:plastocyanin
MRRCLALLAALAVLGAIAASAFAATAHVSLKDDFFTRTSVTIRKGSSVTWTWLGRRRHNVTAVSGPASFHSRTLRHGTYTRRFTRRGTYSITCTLHPGMDMRLRVK